MRDDEKDLYEAIYQQSTMSPDEIETMLNALEREEEEKHGKPDDDGRAA
jgi:hypothetical protein